MPGPRAGQRPLLAARANCRPAGKSGRIRAHDLSSSCPQVAPQAFCRSGRPGACGARPVQCVDRTTPASRLPADRHARRGQNHHCPHSGQKPELRNRRGRRAVRRVRRLSADRRRPVCGLAGNRRRQQHRHRQYPRSAGQRPVRAQRGPLQGVHHRRSAHAVQVGIQRHAENAGRTARPRQIHPGHHRPAKSAGHRAVALFAILAAQYDPAAGGGASGACAGYRTSQLRAGRAHPAGPRGVWLDARCAVAAGPGHCLRHWRSARRRRARHAGRGGPPLSVHPAGGAGRRRRRGADGRGRATGRAQHWF